jgi:peptidoglycan-associated lipoprotein
MKITKALCCITSLGVLLVGCSSTPTKPVATPKTPIAPSTVAANQAVPASVKEAVPEYLDRNSLIYRERSVYFDFDNYAVKTEFSSLLERQGNYLAAHPNLSIKVEGNADERGGAEYNLALGQKRANAVVRALRVFGVKDTQMEAISWGKEKPKAPGHDEAAWAENRRADLVYPTK